MKKTFNLAILALAGMVMFSSCSKEKEAKEFNFRIDSGDAKMHISYIGGTYFSCWDDDQRNNNLMLINGESTPYLMKLSEAEGNKSASVLYEGDPINNNYYFFTFGAGTSSSCVTGQPNKYTFTLDETQTVSTTGSAQKINIPMGAKLGVNEGKDCNLKSDMAVIEWIVPQGTTDIYLLTKKSDALSLGDSYTSILDWLTTVLGWGSWCEKNISGTWTATINNSGAITHNDGGNSHIRHIQSSSNSGFAANAAVYSVIPPFTGRAGIIYVINGEPHAQRVNFPNDGLAAHRISTINLTQTLSKGMNDEIIVSENRPL